MELLARWSDRAFAMGSLIAISMVLLPAMWVHVIATLMRPGHHDSKFWGRWLHRTSWRMLGSVLLVLSLVCWLGVTLLVRPA